MFGLIIVALVGTNPVAKFETTMGTFTAEIYLDRVPRTASNFIGGCPGIICKRRRLPSRKPYFPSFLPLVGRVRWPYMSL